MKHKSYQNLVSMFIDGGLNFRVYLEKGSKDEKKNDTKKKERM